jgi:hypothetical protein
MSEVSHEARRRKRAERQARWRVPSVLEPASANVRCSIGVEASLIRNRRGRNPPRGGHPGGITHPIIVGAVTRLDHPDPDARAEDKAGP